MVCSVLLVLSTHFFFAAADNVLSYSFETTADETFLLSPGSLRAPQLVKTTDNEAVVLAANWHWRQQIHAAPAVPNSMKQTAKSDQPAKRLPVRLKTTDLMAGTDANTSSGPVDAWTARWHGAVGEPYSVPWFTRLLWKEQGCPLSCHLDWNDGSTLMPRGPLLGQGDMGMTIISEQLPECSPAPCAPMPVPGSPSSGNISMQLGSNQLWAVSDNDYSTCHYTEAVCKANGQSIDLINETANGLGCWQGWLPGCRHSFPRRVGFGGKFIARVHRAPMYSCISIDVPPEYT